MAIRQLRLGKRDIMYLSLIMGMMNSSGSKRGFRIYENLFHMLDADAQRYVGEFKMTDAGRETEPYRVPDAVTGYIDAYRSTGKIEEPLKDPGPGWT